MLPKNDLLLHKPEEDEPTAKAHAAERNVLALIQALRLVKPENILAGVSALCSFAWAEKSDELIAAVQGAMLAICGPTPKYVEIMEGYENLLDCADQYLCDYREDGPDNTLLAWGTWGNWPGLAQIAMDQLSTIADGLGLYISWFDAEPRHVPPNYWRVTVTEKSA